MPAPEKDPLIELVKELDRLHDLEIDDAVRDMIWTLISEVDEYRRKKRPRLVPSDPE